MLIALCVREAHAACMMENQHTQSKMSSERLTRVQACRRRAEQESLRGATVVPGECVGVGTDVAMVFMHRGTPTVYFGRVLACYSKVRGADEVLNWPVSLVNAPASLSLQCSWFYPFGRSTFNQYVLGIKNGVLAPDLARFPISAFVGIVDMVEYKRRGKTLFKPCDNGQLERFRAKAREMGPVAVSEEQRNILRQQQIQRENGTYYRTFNNTRR